MSSSIPLADSALEGVRIVDLTRVYAGPACTQMLADHGAEVVKIEPPQGDETRDWGAAGPEGLSSHYWGLNLNKRAIALDQARAEGRGVQLRLRALGRRNWLFCWTEVGAKFVRIVQSLIATCRLHDIDPNTYLVDVLQRVGQHPAARLAELTPRQWKTRFADNPLRSDLHRTAS